MTPWKKWFVHDWNEGFQIFETEQEAKDLFKKILDQYADEASEVQQPPVKTGGLQLKGD